MKTEKVVIKSDDIGRYISHNGWIIRPFQEPRFRVDQEVPIHMIEGTILCAVGKNAACGKDEFVEFWITCGYESETESHESKIATMQFYYGRIKDYDNIHGHYVNIRDIRKKYTTTYSKFKGYEFKNYLVNLLNKKVW